MTKQPDQVLLPIETGGSENFWVEIAHPFSNHIARWNNRYIQPTIVHSNHETGWGHSDWGYFPLGILKSGADV